MYDVRSRAVYWGKKLIFESQMISGLSARNSGPSIYDMYLLPTRKRILRRGLCCTICAFFTPFLSSRFAYAGGFGADVCRRSCLHDCALFPKDPRNRRRLVGKLGGLS